MPSPSRRVALQLATPIALTAIALRFWHIGWGLREQTRFPDEMLFSTPVAAFVPLRWASFEMHNFTYPALYVYIAGLTTAAAYALGLHPEQPSGFSTDTVHVLRLVSATIGVVGVGLVGLLGARLYASRWVGLAAAALLAVTPLHAMHSHIAAADVLLAGCMTLGLLAAYELARRGTVLAAMAAGAAAGVCFAAKQPGLVVLAPAGWAVLEASVRARSLVRAPLLGLVVVGCFVVAYACACPPCVIHWDEMSRVMGMHHALNVSLGMGFTNNHLVPSLGWYGRPYVFQLVATLPYALGWPLYALALVGVGQAVWRHELADRVVLALLIPYFVIMSGGHTVFPRFMIPLFPPLVVLAARVVCSPTDRGIVRRLVLAGVFAYALALTTTQVARFSLDQQREVTQWIATHVARPAEGPIRVGVPCVLKGLDYFQIARPLADAGLAYLPLLDGHWFDDPVDAIVLPQWKAIGYRRDVPDGAPARQLDRLQAGEAGYRFERQWPPSPYLQSGFYTWLDPAYAGDLWQGEIGFSLYVRQ